MTRALWARSCPQDGPAECKFVAAGCATHSQQKHAHHMFSIPLPLRRAAAHIVIAAAADLLPQRPWFSVAELDGFC